MCFIIDTSVSVSSEEWDEARQFLEDVIRGFKVVGPNDVQIGFVTYSHLALTSALLNK